MEITLDPEQKHAIEYDGGPLLIVAGPGSGKTRVLTERVRYLVEKKGAAPEQILCLTFTEKAAEEMSKRLEQYGMDTAGMGVSTFHSFAMKVLEDNELETGLDMRKGVIEKAEAVVWATNHVDDFGLESVKVGNNAHGVMSNIIDGISSFAKELKTPDDIKKYVSKNSPGKDEEEAEGLRGLADLGKVYCAYQKFKEKMRVIDYDDMVAKAVRLFREKPIIRNRYRDKYRHILVDELQDNNVAQFSLVKMLAKDGNVTAVGDEDQSIYGFQGAYGIIFNDFESTFKGTHKALLTTNYRSTKNIVGITNDWMAGKTGASPKKLRSASGQKGERITVAKCGDDKAEAEYVAEKIAEIVDKKGIKYKNVAVLTRRRIDGEKFEGALVERGIPTRYVGSTDLLYTPVVRDLIAYVKAAAEPATSGVEITRLMKIHGITERNIARINRAAKSRAFGSGSGWEEGGGGGAGGGDENDATKSRAFGSGSGEGDCVLSTIRGEDGEGRPKTTQEAEMREFAAKLDELVKIGRGSMPVDKAVRHITMSVSGLYRRVAADDTRQGRKELRQLNEVYRMARSYENLYNEATLAGFVQHLYQIGEREGELRESLPAENAVEITTIHQSKGKEFEAVFVADVAARKLPVVYRRKKFGVPVDMTESRTQDDGEDEKERHHREERRLLYVAMTRAKSKLFITYAEKYGGSKSKPSVFLGEEELNYQDNSRIEVVRHEGSGAGAAIEEPGVIKRQMHEVQAGAITAISGMNLETAVKRIIDLAKIKHFEEHGKLDGFDPKCVLAATDGGGDMNVDLEADKPPRINADTIEFNASKIETYKKCPLQFKYRHVLNVPTRPSGPISAGIAIHAVLEKIAKRRMDGESTTDKQALALLKKHWESADFENRKNADEYWVNAKLMIRNYMKWDADADGRGSTIVDVEKKFSMDIDGLRFTGNIDRVDKEADGKYVVTDYKTGKTPTKQSEVADDIQMNLYALATESVYSKLPTKVMQLFVLGNKEVPNEINNEKLKAGRAVIIDKAKAILNGEFPASPEYMKCRWCDYVDICDSRYPGSEKRR